MLEYTLIGDVNIVYHKLIALFEKHYPVKVFAFNPGIMYALPSGTVGKLTLDFVIYTLRLLGEDLTGIVETIS